MTSKILNKFVFAVVGSVLSFGAIMTSAPGRAIAIAPKTNLNESWSFAFKNYKIQHQGEATIDLKVNYDYKDGIGVNDPLEYPEFTQIYKYIDNYLVNYPNENDFWEIFNKNLVTDLLTKPIPTEFGINYNLQNVVDSLSVQIDVQPGSSNVPYPRSSIVTGILGDKVDLDESWSFAFKDYKIEHQGNAVIDIDVSYDYKDGIGVSDPLEYPEFTQIYNYIDNYLVQYPNENDFWEILNKNLVDELLTKPIPTVFGINYNLADVLDSLTVGINVQPGSSNIPYSRTSTVTGIPGARIAAILPASPLSAKPASASIPEPSILFGLGVLTLISLLRRKALYTRASTVHQ